jgi:hypothetical protein
MVRLAFIDHRLLPAETETLVDQALREEVARHKGNELVGISAIADGADI